MGGRIRVEGGPDGGCSIRCGACSQGIWLAGQWKRSGRFIPVLRKLRCTPILTFGTARKHKSA